MLKALRSQLHEIYCCHPWRQPFLSQKARIELVKIDLPVVNPSWLFPVTLLHLVHSPSHSLPNTTENSLSKTSAGSLSTLRHIPSSSVDLCMATLVVPISIRFYYKQHLPHPNSTARHREQGQLTADLAYEDSAFSVSFFSGCLSHPSTVSVPREAHLVVLHILEWFQI